MPRYAKWLTADARGTAVSWMVDHVKAVGIGGGVAAVVGIILVALMGNDASVCSSGFGQFAQAVDQLAASQCTGYGIGNYLGWTFLIGGIGVTVTAWWAGIRQPSARGNQGSRSESDTCDE